MATTYHNALQQLYVAYFNRPADPGGLAFYEGVMERAAVGGTAQVNAAMAAISADFAKSAEYQAAYNQATFTGVVTQVYNNLFGHAPDSTGLAFYVKALNDKTMTVDTMVTFIANGAQGTDKTAFESKVTVATAFTNALNTPEEIAGYGATASLTAAKTLLSTIKTTTQATAAVTAIDANVAAVIKAGVPFSLQTGLADLATAQDARADFLDAFGEENDIEEADAASVSGAVADAKLGLAGQIDNSTFATATAGVQAALIADQKDLNAKTATAANTNLKAAQDAVAKVTGLAGAISAARSAADGVDEAEEAGIDAMLAYQNAGNTFNTRNPGADFDGSLEGGDLKIADKDGKVIAEMKDGSLVVATGVDAATYVGLTQFVAAVNGAIAAQADFQAAQDASLFAQLRVEMLDLEVVTPSTLTGAFTFTATTVTTPNKPTYNQIVDELSARTAAAVTAQAAVDAAETPTQQQLNLAASTAASVTAFRGQISAFIENNDTPLADAVIRAEEGTLAQAKARLDAIDDEDLADAIDAKDDLDAATEAYDEVNEAYGEVRVDFIAANTVTPVTVNANGTVDVTAGGADVVILQGGVLVATGGANNTNFPGLDDFLVAANLRLTAQNAVTAAALTQDETDVLAANSAAVAAYDAAVIQSNSSVAATRAIALGTEGAAETISDLAEAEEALVDANAAAAQLKSLDAAVTAATDAFAAHDYIAPSFLGASAFGTTGSDIFVVNKVNSTITNFGRSGDDALFIGNGYTLNTGDFAKDGKDDVLEVFFVQQGNNTVVTIETKAFGSNSVEAEIKITLTGVDADDLSFSNGIISM